MARPIRHENRTMRASERRSQPNEHDESAHDASKIEGIINSNVPREVYQLKSASTQWGATVRARDEGGTTRMSVDVRSWDGEAGWHGGGEQKKEDAFSALT